MPVNNEQAQSVVEGGFRPSSLQEALLRASLMKGADAVNAWREWRSAADIDHLNQGSFRLLPLLYRNLRAHSVEDPLMSRLRGIHRRTWYENQILFHQLSALLRAFQEAGIPTMILKGSALTRLCYRDMGLRPMSDIDLLVHTEDSLAAFDLLVRCGWKPQASPPRKSVAQYCSTIHGIEFAIPPDRLCDLHWHVLSECCHAGADDDFWGAAVMTEVNGVPTMALNTTDQLLHVCVHGARWNVVPPIRWVADAAIIINDAESRIDWARLCKQAQERRLALPLREALRYLTALLDAPIPPSALQNLQRIPMGTIERMEYKVRIRPPGLLGYLPESCLRHLAYSKGSLPGRIVRLPRALQYFWGADHLWKLPFYAARKAVRRISA